MAVWGHAKQEHLNFSGELDHRDPATVNVVNFHTNGGGANLKPWFDTEYERTHERVGAHFQIYRDGTVVQLVDTALVIYAAYQLSVRAIEVETEDDGHPSRPWTSEQLASIHNLVQWAKSEHPAIEYRLMQNANDAGIGYHQLFREYNQSGHNCPGAVRVAQLTHEVVPHLQGGHAEHAAQQHAPSPVGVLPLPHNRYDEDTVRWQKQMVHRGWSNLTVDGIFGRQSQEACKLFQAEKHLHQSGIVDRPTWSATWTEPITHD